MGQAVVVEIEGLVRVVRDPLPRAEPGKGSQIERDVGRNRQRVGDAGFDVRALDLVQVVPDAYRRREGHYRSPPTHRARQCWRRW